MRFLRNFLFWFFLLLVSGNLILLGYFYSKGHTTTLSEVLSPLSKTLTKVPYQQVNAQGFWQPKLQSENETASALPLTAHSAISYDLSNEKLLYGKGMNERLPIASLTKIMTAVIAIENLDMNSKVTVSKSAAEIGEGSMGLSYGETLTLEELLYGLLLQSGNDAAEAIAQGSKFGRENFIHLMNKKAEDLGLSNTRFTNPSGLQGDGEQYSTVKELLVLTRFALEKPEFAKIVATYQHDITATVTHKGYTLFNETNLLTTYPGVKGVKTGFTDEAGMCLISYLEYKDHKIIGVILNSANRRQEMMDLLDFSLKQAGTEPPKHS